MDKDCDSTGMTYWERVASTRWGHYLSRIEERSILRASLLAGKPSQALEIGCEGGRWSRLLADSGWQMTCTDVDAKMLVNCRQKVPAAKCILANSHEETIPCGPESMGLLLCVEVAPVITSRWFLPEANRVLRPNGILMGTCWNRTSLRGTASRLKEWLRPTTDTAFYNCPYSEWKRDVARAGFQLVQEEGLCWGFFGRMSNSPLIPLFARLERLLQLHRMTAWSPWIVFIARKRCSNET